MKLVIRNIVPVVLACSAISANAASYGFEFLSQDYEVSGTLTVADTQNALGTHDILGITGIVWGDGGGNITGLVNNPNQPDPNTNFGFFWDNVLPLNGNGVLFSVGGGSRWNMFQDGQGYRLFSWNAEGPTNVVDSFGTFAATQLAPVPEPETYAMMLAGLGLLGLTARRRNQKAVA